MLPSSQRINKAYFKEIFEKGFFFQGEYMSLVILKKPEITLKNSKFAFSVSKKIIKSSVERNKLRRCGYSVLKNLINEVKPSYLGVFLIKKKADQMSSENYKKEIENLLSKSKLT